jgi:hypothetical protein
VAPYRGVQAWVEVIAPDGSSTPYRLTEDQVTLGSSPTAGIPLVNADDLLPEHMMIAPRQGGCWISVAPNAPAPATINGRLIVGEDVPWGSELDVGRYRLRVTNREPKIRRKAGQAVSSPVIGLLFIAIPLVAWLLLSDDEQTMDFSSGGDPPALFDSMPECPSGGDTAHEAREAELAAGARAERYPFSSQDGIEAVRSYAIAASCFERVGNRRDATRMSRQREALVSRMESDYQVHLIRLDHALKNQRLEDALVEATALRAMLDHKPDSEFHQWLVLLERRLQLVIDQGWSS